MNQKIINRIKNNSQYGKYGQDRFYQLFSHVESTDTIWVTRDNREIPIEEMDPEHLINSYRMLKNAQAKIPYLMTKRINQIREESPEYLL